MASPSTDLTDQAAAAAKRAAEEISAELERLAERGEDATDRDLNEAELLRSARERLAKEFGISGARKVVEQMLGAETGSPEMR